MLPDLHIGFSRGRSGGLVFPSISEFSTVSGDPHSQGFGIVNKPEIDIFLELSCFFDDPIDVGNLTSGSFAFSKTSLKTRDQIANIRWIMEKAREFQKNISFCLIDYAKAFDCVDHNKLWTILKEMGIPDHLTCLLRNLYAGQEATVRTEHGTTDWFQIGKGVCQGCILYPAYLTSMQST